MFLKHRKIGTDCVLLSTVTYACSPKVLYITKGMDSPQVMGIGVGLFVLVFLWVLSLLLCVLLARASQALRFVSVGVFLLTVVITLILVFFPKQTPSVPVVKEPVITDEFFIGRYVLLVFSLLALLVAIALAVVFHVLEPVRGQPLKSR